MVKEWEAKFPFLFGRAFIEAAINTAFPAVKLLFPFLFGRAFIEAESIIDGFDYDKGISLPFRKGFH